MIGVFGCVDEAAFESVSRVEADDCSGWFVSDGEVVGEEDHFWRLHGCLVEECVDVSRAADTAAMAVNGPTPDVNAAVVT